VTLFEYVSVSFSIVLSLAVVRLIGGLADAFARSRTYWVHGAWVIHQLLFVAYVWWNTWSYRDVRWTFAEFFAVLVGISLVYYQAAALVPTAPSAVGSWRDHFFAVRRQYFGAMAAWVLVILFNTSFVMDVPLVHVARISQAITFAIAVLGLSSARPALHGALALAIFALWPFRIAVMLNPGALTSR
jgi:hypothetical protein